jgi:hypothetical protein
MGVSLPPPGAGQGAPAGAFGQLFTLRKRGAGRGGRAAWGPVRQRGCARCGPIEG